MAFDNTGHESAMTQNFHLKKTNIEKKGKERRPQMAFGCECF